MVAGVPDSAGVIMNSAGLGDIGHALDGLGIIYVVVAPVLLFLTVRRIRHQTHN